jgi:hypothetical protein
MKSQILNNNVLHPSHRVENDVSHDVLRLLPAGSTTFPGAMPKGLRCTSLNYMSDVHNRTKYMATAKLDGVRVLAIVCSEGLFLVDRTMSVFRVETAMTLPLGGKHCVFDGELMDSRYFFAFDAMVVNGTCIDQQPFKDRYVQLCTFLKEVPIQGTVCFVPKRMHRMEDLTALFAVLMPNKNTHVFSVQVADVVQTDWIHLVHGECTADGIIFMDETDTIHFNRQSFGLVKWKKTATFDVLMDMKDLCNTLGEPRRGNLVQTFYWEYSERMGQSVRVPFARCMTTRGDRVSIWEQRMQMQRSSTVCVECFRNNTGWHVLRCRPEKHRSNSARAIMDTLWIAKEDLSMGHIRRAFDHRYTVLGPSLPVVHDDICSRLAWLGYTWAQASDICELELRLIHEGTSSIPACMFHRIVQRLQMTTSMVQSEIVSSDYTCGSVRMTNVGDTSYAIQKELGFRTDLILPEMSPLGMRCALSYEHPSPSPVPVSSRCTSRRQKRRWRFVHRETVAIDCTYVQTMDCRDTEITTDSYEIEIELLRSSRYNNIPYEDCSGLILSMIWRMLRYVLDVPVETTQILSD